VTSIGKDEGSKDSVSEGRREVIPDGDGGWLSESESLWGLFSMCWDNLVV
jgi:hypothetical protein